MTCSQQMPRYKCHKEVWALKILEVFRENNQPRLRVDGGFEPIAVDDDYCAKHRPEAGGYYVVYADGYKSYSPAQAFEEGYTKVGG